MGESPELVVLLSEDGAAIVSLAGAEAHRLGCDGHRRIRRIENR